MNNINSLNALNSLHLITLKRKQDKKRIEEIKKKQKQQKHYQEIKTRYETKRVNEESLIIALAVVNGIPLNVKRMLKRKTNENFQRFEIISIGNDILQEYAIQKLFRMYGIYVGKDVFSEQVISLKSNVKMRYLNESILNNYMNVLVEVLKELNYPIEIKDSPPPKLRISRVRVSQINDKEKQIKFKKYFTKIREYLLGTIGSPTGKDKRKECFLTKLSEELTAHLEMKSIDEIHQKEKIDEIGKKLLETVKENYSDDCVKNTYSDLYKKGLLEEYGIVYNGEEMDCDNEIEFDEEDMFSIESLLEDIGFTELSEMVAKDDFDQNMLKEKKKTDYLIKMLYNMKDKDDHIQQESQTGMSMISSESVSKQNEIKEIKDTNEIQNEMKEIKEDNEIQNEINEKQNEIIQSKEINENQQINSIQSIQYIPMINPIQNQNQFTNQFIPQCIPNVIEIQPQQLLMNQLLFQQQTQFDNNGLQYYQYQFQPVFIQSVPQSLYPNFI